VSPYNSRPDPGTENVVIVYGKLSFRHQSYRAVGVSPSLTIRLTLSRVVSSGNISIQTPEGRALNEIQSSVRKGMPEKLETLEYSCS